MSLLPTLPTGECSAVVCFLGGHHDDEAGLACQGTMLGFLLFLFFFRLQPATQSRKLVFPADYHDMIGLKPPIYWMSNAFLRACVCASAKMCVCLCRNACASGCASDCKKKEEKKFHGCLNI